MTMPGYGDPETWPSYRGGNDPRGPIDYADCSECGKETTDVELYIETEMCPPCFDKHLSNQDYQPDAHLEMDYEDRYESL